jgi:uncharacterized protein YndB with AHSA1/START domain
MSEDLDQRRGTVTAEPDGSRRLEFRRSWPDPIEDVWSALTEPERLARWIGSYDGERAPGATGTLTMTFEGEAGGQPMTIVECDAPRRLVVAGGSQGMDWKVELDLSAEGGRTVLRFRQVFAAGTDVRDFALGWHWYLDKLDTVVSGRPAPGEWEDFLADVGPGYAPDRT